MQLVLPAGFHVELVASEPLIQVPIAIDWDADVSQSPSGKVTFQIIKSLTLMSIPPLLVRPGRNDAG